MMANYLNECETAGENPSWSLDEKPLSSCDKRILQIAQKPIADAENTARKTVPKTRFLGDSSRDGKPIACAIWGCLGAINLSQISLDLYREIEGTVPPSTGLHTVAIADKCSVSVHQGFDFAR
jgi:hypothetical protein